MCIRDRLKRELGAWLCPSNRQWHAYYDPSLRVVIILDQNTWHHYTEIQKFRRYWSIPKNQNIFDTTPPTGINGLEPLDVLKTSDTSYLVSLPVPIVADKSSVSSYTTWHQYLSSLTPWERSLLNDLNHNIEDCWSAFIHLPKKWHIVSDGSYEYPKASYSWIIHNEHKIILSATGAVSGNPPTALRAELQGVLAWYCVIHHIITYYDLHPNIEVYAYSDNTTAIAYNNSKHCDDLPQQQYFADHDYYYMSTRTSSSTEDYKYNL